jgi:hypothetical protein
MDAKTDGRNLITKQQAGLSQNDAIGGNHETHEEHERNGLVVELEALFAASYFGSWLVSLKPILPLNFVPLV